MWMLNWTPEKSGRVGGWRLQKLKNTRQLAEKDVHWLVCWDCLMLCLINVSTFWLQPSSLHHKLVCYYFHNNRNPRLIIRPVKVEILYPDPKIYVLREIVTEREMERLKVLAAPKVSGKEEVAIHLEWLGTLYHGSAVIFFLFFLLLTAPAAKGNCQKHGNWTF